VGQLSRPPAGSARGGTSAESGFTLLEVLVALVVLGVALILGLGLLAQQHRVLARLEAQERADRAVRRVLEELRSGAVPLDEGLSVVSATSAVPAAAEGGTDDLRLVVRVRRLEPPPNLFEASVEAHYRVLGRDRLRRVETLFWKPEKAKLTP
jgi:prepilin-type N-terminal cleavage/methylation domain-containing protein